MSILTVHDLQGLSAYSNTVRVPSGHKLDIEGQLKFPSWTTATRPSGVADGVLGLNTQTRSLEMYYSTAGGWVTIKKWGNDGSAPEYAAASAATLHAEFPDLGDGTYWINVGGVPTELYCDMTTSGGGWTSFASVNAGNAWFPDNINGNVAVWSTMPSYNYGAYDKTGGIGTYWRSYTLQSPTEILFKTGNGTYWIHFPLNQIYASPNGSQHQISATATSNNYPGTYDSNNTISIMHRNPNGGEDPWINAGNTHANGNNASGTDYMFWGENGSTGHNAFKIANGGILAFIR